MVYSDTLDVSNWRMKMANNIREKISHYRGRIIPAVIAASLLSGIVVSVMSTSDAQANSYAACSSGYSGSACNNPHATKVVGSALVGGSVKLTINGVGFYGAPKITSNEPGTKVLVLHDNGVSLEIKIITPAGARVGEHTLTIRLADGKTFKINYLVK
jgi:hypothetical protein